VVINCYVCATIIIHGHIHVRISWLSEVHSDVIARLKLESRLVDFCGDYIGTCLPRITSLLYEALGQRVALVATKPLPDAAVSLSTMTTLYTVTVNDLTCVKNI